ncbi:hypothetical protein NCCP2495_18340 [Dietzia sp. NCCP-2495]|uniref:hypothetical protein n=1 Tax=Dietzia sp. NCCP-2495 TaxID=2934675 RepID=UPI00223124FF|nr:hypothetical protein [Dietzia sp. NCCP-2495]GLB63955.1 hypothetical protein NCCP2495_18340 [Dietzia sp. NCCP-2495]
MTTYDAFGSAGRTLAIVGTAFLLAGCTSTVPDDRVTETVTVTTSAAGEKSTVAPSQPDAHQPALQTVDAREFSSPQHDGVFTWNYSTSGQYRGLCVSDGDGVTCTGRPAASVPDLTQHFPGRPSAIELGTAGLRYTFVEGVPGGPGSLDAGHRVEIGNVACERPDGSALTCRSGANSFTITGPGQEITTSGTVLAESDYSNHSMAEDGGETSSRDRAGTSTGQPSDLMGATGLVGGVRTSSGRLVTASAPPCDGRGILILDSYVEALNPQQGIADLLDAHPGAKFATPGQCPSLRASLDGARVYPIYTDHGHDTAALCRDKAARGGNARLLTQSAEYIDPC